MNMEEQIKITINKQKPNKKSSILQIESLQASDNNIVSLTICKDSTQQIQRKQKKKRTILTNTQSPSYLSNKLLCKSRQKSLKQVKFTFKQYDFQQLNKLNQQQNKQNNIQYNDSQTQTSMINKETFTKQEQQKRIIQCQQVKLEQNKQIQQTNNKDKQQQQQQINQNEKEKEQEQEQEQEGILKHNQEQIKIQKPVQDYNKLEVEKNEQVQIQNNEQEKQINRYNQLLLFSQQDEKQQIQKKKINQNTQKQKINQKITPPSKSSYQNLFKQNIQLKYPQQTQKSNRKSLRKSLRKSTNTQTSQKLKYKSIYNPTGQNYKQLSKHGTRNSRINQNHLNSHSKEKQQQFQVPIILNKDQHNKSKYLNQQYSPLKDKHLRNFFVTRNKRNYINCQNKIKKYKNKQNKIKKTLTNENYLEKQEFDKMIQNTYRKIKNQSNYDQKLNYSRIKQQKENIQSLSNTKFLINILPSQKTKRFFHQSISTFINHNYRPIISNKTSRYEKEKNNNNKSNQKNQNQIKNTSNLNQSKLQKSKSNYKQVSCDQLARLNSYKRAVQNSFKGKKLKGISNLSAFYEVKRSQKYYINKNNVVIKTNQTIYTKKNIQNNPNKNQNQQKSQNVRNNKNNKGYYKNQKQQQKLITLKSFNNDQCDSQIRQDELDSFYTKRYKKLENQVMPKVYMIKQMGIKIPMKNVKKNPFNSDNSNEKYHQTLR